MRSVATILIVCMPLFAGAATNHLQIARNALRDGLFSVAHRHADIAISESSPRTTEAQEAVCLSLETFAKEGKPNELLVNADAIVSSDYLPHDDPGLSFWRANALLKLQRYQEAVKVASAATNELSVFRDGLLCELAEAEEKSGHVPEALSLYESIDSLSTNYQLRADNALLRAKLLASCGKNTEALSVLKAQSSLPVVVSSMGDGDLLRGKLLLKEGKSEEAETQFKKAAMDARTTEAVRVDALLELSAVALANAKTNEAIAFARTAVSRSKQPTMRRVASFRLGDLLCANAETLDEASQIVRELVRENPDDSLSSRALRKMADSFLRCNRPKEAAEEYRIYLETYAASAEDFAVLEGRAWALQKLGRNAESSVAFARAAELAPDDSSRAFCFAKQADAIVASGQLAEAASIYAKAAKCTTNISFAADAFMRSGNLLERAGLAEKAVEAYSSVTNIFQRKAESSPALMRIASLQAASGHYDDALRTYGELLSLQGVSPENYAEALMGRGRVHYNAFRFNEALQDFAAVADAPGVQHDEARFHIVLCLYGMGRDKDAKDAADAFLLAFPSSPRVADILLWLGKFSYNHADWASAKKYFLEYLSRWPDAKWKESALIWSARAAFSANDFKDCLLLISKFQQEWPQSPRIPEVTLLEADALIELARFEDAVLLLGRITANDPGGEWAKRALLRKGDCLFTMGAGNALRYEEALAAYEERLKIGGMDSDAILRLQFKIARCLERLGRGEEAVERYYSDVMMRYLQCRENGDWLGEDAGSLFLRAAFAIADIHEREGRRTQAIQILRRAGATRIPGAEEAGRRLEILKNKKAGE